MSIEKNIFVVEPTTRRAKAPASQVFVTRRGGEPGDSIAYLDDQGELVVIDNPAEKEGQLTVQWIEGAGDYKTMRLWCAIDVLNDGNLVWKPVMLYTTTGRYTNKKLPVLTT